MNKLHDTIIIKSYSGWEIANENFLLMKVHNFGKRFDKEECCLANQLTSQKYFQFAFE